MRTGILALIKTPGIAPDLPSALERQARQHGLTAIETDEKLLLFAGAMRPIQRSRPGAPTVLGDLFARPAGDGSTGDPGRASDHWGNYVALGIDETNKGFVLRAPLTGMPIYWATIDGAVLVFSHLELARGLPGLDLAIDWDFVRHSLAYRNLRTARTGITGISELLPGTRLTESNSTIATETWWSPWSFTSHNRPVGNPGALAEAVERTVLDCIAAWTERRGKILLELSGGLDSSIVAAGLVACGADFECVTVATHSADGDERHYARDVAAIFGVQLHESPHRREMVDLARAPETLTPRPAAYNVLRGLDRAIDRVFQERAGQTYCSGIGGDNVFCFTHSIAPAIDAWRQRGPGRVFARALSDIARIADTTLWHTSGAALRRLRRGTPPSLWPAESKFITPGALPVSPERHPWLDQGADIDPGDKIHVDALLRIGDFLDRPDRWYDGDVVTPLLSQPLVELCLGIPSWRWIEGGRDRAIARRAFAKRLPDSIINRRTKGRLETMCAAAFVHDCDKLASLLLDGRLASQDLLDRTAIEVYLASGDLDRNFDYFRLMELADLELWIESIEAAY